MKQLVLAGALLAAAGYKAGKDLGWYAARRLGESNATRSRPA